jgi:hypothetical protein
VRPTQPPVQLVIRFLSVGVKQPEREADHSPPSNSKFKNEWSNASPLLTLFCFHAMHWGILRNYRCLNVHVACGCSYCVMLYQLLSLRGTER